MDYLEAYSIFTTQSIVCLLHTVTLVSYYIESLYGLLRSLYIICMYVCMYVCMYIYTCVYVLLCMHMYMYMCIVYVHVYVYVCVYIICMHACMHVCIHVYVYIYMYIYVYIYAMVSSQASHVTNLHLSPYTRVLHTSLTIRTHTHTQVSPCPQASHVSSAIYIYT